MTARAILAIDQGTTSTRSLVFDAEGGVLGEAQRELQQYYPASGWVEHDAEEIWQAVLATARQALATAGLGARDIAGIGITNQRETTVLWERATGLPLHRAIVWQDRRTAARCAQLTVAGHAAEVQAKTGLVLDPYFSATKIEWLLDHVPGARTRAERGEIAAGTIDSFLLWRLTGSAAHATDATNAARTMLFDIGRQDWDAGLLSLFRVPRAVLPAVKDCAGFFGATTPDLFGAPIPVLGIAGDQQAATVGQACFAPGMIKSTYGTGCFVVLNTGAKPVISRNRLLTTLAYRLEGKPTYAVEGAIFIAGAAVQWLRDGLGLVRQAGETEALARAADPARQVYLVPAFTGLGAPYWDADGARRPLRPDAGRRPRRDRARNAGSRLLSDPRPPGGDARRRRQPHQPPGRRRHGGERLADAATGGSPGIAGRAPAPHRDHRARRRGAGRPRRRDLSLPRRHRPAMGPRPLLRARACQ